jgi:hypothetical protein
MSEEKRKKCSAKGGCGKKKAISKFALNPAKKDGHDDLCKDCKKKYRAEYHLKNKDKENKKNLDYYDKNKEDAKKKMKEYYARNRERLAEKARVRAQTLKEGKE